MAHVTDYGLALTELAGALMVLAFLRALLLYARSLFRPAPVIAPVPLPAMFRKAPRTAARAAIEPTQILPSAASPQLSLVASELPLSSVILAANSMHTEEAVDGSRSFYWSLVRFRHQRPENDA